MAVAVVTPHTQEELTGGCQRLRGGEGDACAHLCAVHSQLPLPRAHLLEDGPLWDLQGVPGFGLAMHSGSQPRAAAMTGLQWPFTGLGTSPGISLHPRGVSKPFTKVR